MNKFGTFLFRWRGIIGFIAFVVVWLLERPNWSSILISVPFLLIGLFFRIWANGYLGKEGRSTKIMAKTLITQGPYRYTRNPLYLGNFFLTTAILISLNPPFYFIISILFLFWVEYLLIIQAEQDFLINQFGESYLVYMKSTGMIFPVFSRKPIFASNDQRFQFKNAIREIQTIVILLLIYGLIYLKKGIQI